MRRVNSVALVSALALFTGAAFAQFPVRPAGVGAVQMAPPTAARIAAVTHGTWEKGPGTYHVTICASGCTINGAPGSTINLVIETWGAGGSGGGGGQTFRGKYGTSGGGGGGGYISIVKTVIVPAGWQPQWDVTVGTGGTPGYGGNYVAGGASEVRVGGSGQIVVGATGGPAGDSGNSVASSGGAGGIASAGSPGNVVSHPGSAGAIVNTCNGGGGGAGGAGSGPGAINHGGNGGHGGYFNGYVDLTQVCTSLSSMTGLSLGSAGANGRVKIVW